MKKKTWIVHFVEDDYAANAVELKTTQGSRRFIFWIEAETAEAAYLEGVQKARSMTDRTFRLNSCKESPASRKASGAEAQ